MVSFKPELKVLTHPEELTRTAVEEFVSLAREATRGGGFFAVALSGGSTPRGLYSRLAEDVPLRTRLPWERIHFFWGDEQHVPPEHPDSNYRMVKEVMLSKVSVPPGNVHRIRSENPDADQAAREYEEELRAFFHLKIGETPRFDLVLLGMGTDGHTASLFPGTQGLSEQRRLVVANWVPKLNAFRISLTLPVLNSASCVLFLVSGGEKTEILREVLEGKAQPPFPAQLIQPKTGRCLWLVDQAAAGFLKNYLATEFTENY